MIQENSESDSDEKMRALIESGTDIVTGSVGGALGFLAGGPAGAAALGAGGIMAGKVLKKFGKEISDRFLGPREAVRVGAVIAIAAEEIRERLERGDDLRQDDFFEERQFGRSDADEVTESAVLKCQKDPQEKKIPYVARLFSNIVFDSEIGLDMSHQLLKLAERLSYRQFCLLRLAVMKQDGQLRATDYREQGNFSPSLYQVLHECLDLYQRGLINNGGDVAFGVTDINPGGMTIQGMGAALYNNLGLARIPNEDLVPLRAVLR